MRRNPTLHGASDKKASGAHAASNLLLGFTVFRPETVRFAERAMQGRDLIVLEEPQTPGFSEMLAGELPVDEYVMLTDFEFPEYAKLQSSLLQKLHNQGAHIEQIHPWLDRLITVQEFFASGKGPADVPKGSPEESVYLREKVWTSALVNFYEASSKGDFDEMIEAVMAFAKMDALKINDIDRSRAESVASYLRERPGFENIYVECGAIHIDMIMFLRRRLQPSGPIRVVHLMEETCKPRFGRRRMLPPGDILTFRYLLGKKRDVRMERLLSARAVVYNKLIRKDEMVGQDSATPHLEDEALVIGLVSALDYDECKKLHPVIQSLSAKNALEVVKKTMN